MTAAKRPWAPKQPSIPCPRDGTPMTLIKTIPRVGSYPELKTYRCQHCQHVETIEAKTGPI